MINAKMLGMLVAAFAAGTFIASPLPAAIAAVIATDVQCAGCVGTSDLAGNAVTAVKIKDGEVKATEIATNAVGSSEIGTDAVGAAEIQGVTKLLFAHCKTSGNQNTTPVASGGLMGVTCSINGVDADDTSAAAMSSGNTCFGLMEASTNTNVVNVYVRNFCPQPETIGQGEFGIIVYDK